MPPVAASMGIRLTATTVCPPPNTVIRRITRMVPLPRDTETKLIIQMEELVRSTDQKFTVTENIFEPIAIRRRV